MKKTAKKTDASVIRALTLACEEAKDWCSGFTWLTHTAEYPNFPQSLMITCVFETDDDLTRAIDQGVDAKLRDEITLQLQGEGIHLKHPMQHIALDTEQACARENQGNWKQRLWID